MDDHIKIEGPGASAALESGWAKNQAIIAKFTPAHQNELKIAYQDTLRLLKEREVAK